MSASDYIWFWKFSWSYMRGSRMEFWLGLPKATLGYRKIIIEDRKKGYRI